MLWFYKLCFYLILKLPKSWQNYFCIKSYALFDDGSNNYDKEIQNLFILNTVNSISSGLGRDQLFELRLYKWSKIPKAKYHLYYVLVDAKPNNIKFFYYDSLDHALDNAIGNNLNYAVVGIFQGNC